MTPVTRTLLTAAVLVSAASPRTPIGAQSSPKRLVALLAHADDETAAAPALARYAREGVQVYMVIATDGSGGTGSQAYLQRSDSGPVGDALVKARAEEARCAAVALGAQEPVLLAFPDGKLGDYLGDRTLVSRLTDSSRRQSISRFRCHSRQAILKRRRKRSLAITRSSTPSRSSACCRRCSVCGTVRSGSSPAHRQ